jgi:hypothetical protein
VRQSGSIEISEQADKTERNKMFFMFEQSNAGGFYVEGLPERLFVEAPTEAEAIKIAEARGVDFEDGCPGCCGNRWYAPLRDANGNTSDSDIMEAMLYALDNKISHELIWQ